MMAHPEIVKVKPPRRDEHISRELLAREHDCNSHAKEEKVKCWPDFEVTAHHKPIETDGASLRIFPEQKPRNQEATKHKEQVDTNPPDAAPSLVIREMSPDHEQDCNSAQDIK